MHILFVHKNFPAQFGHIAGALSNEQKWRCTFVSEHKDAAIGGIDRIRYAPIGGADESTHYLSRSFENAIAHAHGVYETCKSRITKPPDLVVGHSGFGSTLFLSDLWPAVPIINYFEYFYHGRGSDMDFRPDFAPAPMDFLRARARNAMLLLDLQNCAAGYSPTEWQRSRFPVEYRQKIECIFDGIDRTVWRRKEGVDRVIGGRAISPETRIVTYAARGLESMRGFDIFMNAARRICASRSDVIFVIVGDDRICYGGDEKHIGSESFKEHVLRTGAFELSRFIFTGQVAPQQLAEIFSLSDLHIYLTVPFVLSWSLMNALACGCTVLASDTAPVREIIRHEENGLLAGFFEPERVANEALRVLDDPAAYRARLGRAGEQLIDESYALTRTLPNIIRFFERVKHAN